MSLLCLCTTLSSGDRYNRKKGGTRRLLVFSRWIRLESDPHTVLLKSVCHLLNFLVFCNFVEVTNSSNKFSFLTMINWLNTKCILKWWYYLVWDTSIPNLPMWSVALLFNSHNEMRLNTIVLWPLCTTAHSSLKQQSSVFSVWSFNKLKAIHSEACGLLFSCFSFTLHENTDIQIWINKPKLSPWLHIVPLHVTVIFLLFGTGQCDEAWQRVLLPISFVFALLWMYFCLYWPKLSAEVRLKEYFGYRQTVWAAS